MSVLVLSVPNSPTQTGAVPAALMYSQYLFQMASRLASVVLLVNHGCAYRFGFGGGAVLYGRPGGGRVVLGLGATIRAGHALPDCGHPQGQRPLRRPEHRRRRAPRLRNPGKRPLETD